MRRLVVLALLTAVSCAAPNDRAQSTGARATVAPVAIRPAGLTSTPFTFEWTGDVSAVYQVSVFDEVQRLLSTTSVRGNRLPSPPELDQLFDKGGTFNWRVTLVDDAENAVGASALTEFRISPRRN